MTDFEHVRVLSAYLMRLRPVVFKRLNEANRLAWQEQLNGNSRSQLEALENELDVIREAISGMTDSDKKTCARIVRESLEVSA